MSWRTARLEMTVWVLWKIPPRLCEALSHPQVGPILFHQSCSRTVHGGVVQESPNQHLQRVCSVIGGKVEQDQQLKWKALARVSLLCFWQAESLSKAEHCRMPVCMSTKSCQDWFCRAGHLDIAGSFGYLSWQMHFLGCICSWVSGAGKATDWIESLGCCIWVGNHCTGCAMVLAFRRTAYCRAICELLHHKINYR